MKALILRSLFLGSFLFPTFSAADSPNSIDPSRPASEAVFALYKSCLDASFKKFGVKDEASRQAILSKAYCSCMGDAFSERKDTLKYVKECAAFAKNAESKSKDDNFQALLNWSHFNRRRLSTIQISLSWAQCENLIAEKAQIPNKYFCSCFTDGVVVEAEKRRNDIGKKIPKDLRERLVHKCIDWKPLQK